MIGAALVLTAALTAASPLVYVEKQGVPWTSFRIAIPTGADPGGKSGLARAAGLLIAAQLADSSSAEEPRLLARLGVALRVSTTQEATIIEGGAPEGELDAAMKEIFRVLASLEVGESSLRAALDRAIADRRALSGSDRVLAELEMRRQIFGAHRHPHGEIAELAAITADDVRALWRQHLRAGAISVGLATSIPEADAAKRVDQWLAALPAGRTPERALDPVPLAPASAPKGRRVVIIDKPGRRDAEILLGMLSGANDRRWPAMLAANAIVGGSFSSRLGRALAQIKSTRAPIASSSIDRRVFSVAVTAAPEDSARAVRTVLEQLGRIAFEGLDAPELVFGRRHAAARVMLDLADPAGRLDAEISARLAGLPPGAGALLSRSILAVSDRDVDAAARALSSTDDAVIVIVASATPALQRELAGVPGIRSVSIVGYEDR